MAKHIANVSANIDKFVDGFSKNNFLEYNLSVVTVYDERRFTSDKYLNQFSESDKIYDRGAFRPVRSAPEVIAPEKYFISSSDFDLINLLKNTLKVPVQDLSDGGPEVEEAFSPLASIYGLEGYELTPSSLAKAAGFFMGPESYKIVFLRPRKTIN